MTLDEAGGATTKVLAGTGDREPALLIVSAGPPRVVPLRAGQGVTIGRAATADVVLDDESLSRHHATFRLVGDRIEVEDQGSSNGTVVHGQRLAPRKPSAVVAGDAVHLGNILVVIQLRAGSVADRLRPAAAAGPGDELVARIAASALSVLVLGETGVGKEVMAERLHALSTRRDRPLVKLNCAALMTSVLESELFGHEKGAFTGAVKDKPGLIESADGGTLFLDEIGEADPGVQVKLLRVLESRESQRVGALKPRIVDVRFIAATNRVPAEQIAAGTLRQDLYYRLAGFTITVPPLRDRKDQLAALASELLARHAEGGAVKLGSDALARLMRHDWPGNVRELRNVLDRAVVIAGRRVLAAADIDQALAAETVVAGHGRTAPSGARPSPSSSPSPSPSPSPSSSPSSSASTGGDPERDRILAVLDECGGNQSMAAERLGISRRTLVYRLQSWGLTKPRRR